jgi:hypothetical protein
MKSSPMREYTLFPAQGFPDDGFRRGMRAAPQKRKEP